MGKAAKKELSRVERKRLARQEKMVELSLKIVAEGGIEALTIKRLAQEMDLVMGAIYRYFPGKKSLLASLQMRAMEAIEEQIDKELLRVGGYLEEQGLKDEVLRAMVEIWAMAQTYFSLGHRFPGYGRLLNATLSSPEPFWEAEEMAEGEATLWRILSKTADAFQVALGGGISKDEGLRYGYMAWATLHGLSQFRKRDRLMPDYLQTELLQPLVFGALFRGWGMEPTKVEQSWELFEAFVAQKESN